MYTAIEPRKNKDEVDQSREQTEEIRHRPLDQRRELRDELSEESTEAEILEATTELDVL